MLLRDTLMPSTKAASSLAMTAVVVIIVIIGVILVAFTMLFVFILVAPCQRNAFSAMFDASGCCSIRPRLETLTLIDTSVAIELGLLHGTSTERGRHGANRIGLITSIHGARAASRTTTSSSHQGTIITIS